jgi:thymidine kinase
MHLQEIETGRIEVIIGGMFSGKTEELIRRLKRFQIARKKVQIFKPSLDIRYSTNEVVSHSGLRLQAHAVQDSLELMNLVDPDTYVVGVDEVQFFDNQIPHIADCLANRGVTVILAGLDMDSSARPFGPIPDLICHAEQVTKLHAVCEVCGSPAQYSYRIDDSKELIALGEKDRYKALCRKHYVIANKSIRVPKQGASVSGVIG